MCNYPDVFESWTPKARKEHTCCECGGVIQKGEVYSLCSGLWDGSWSSFKQCIECNSLMEKIAGKDRDSCIAYGELYDYVLNSDSQHPEWRKEFVSTIEKRNPEWKGLLGVKNALTKSEAIA